MKIAFRGDVQDLLDGIRALAPEIGIEVEEGAPAPVQVQVERRPGPIEVTRSGGEGTIRFAEKIHFFRALGLFVEESQRSDAFSVTEESQFTTLGAMIDASRNGVLKVESMEFLLRKMALMGLNLVMLYTEDTYDRSSAPLGAISSGFFRAESQLPCHAVTRV